MLILRDLAVVLLLSFAIGVLFSRLRQPVVLGYILAGIASGPYALRLVENIEVVNAFADLGIVLLMFSLGLEFNIRKLRRVGGVSLVASLSGILLLLGIGQTLGIALGFSPIDAAFLGAALAISSTAIVVKLLTERALLHTEYAPVMLGILVVEDVAAVVLLTLFSGISLLTPLSLQVALDVLTKIVLFFFIAYVLGVKLVPALLERIARWDSSGEVLLISALALCFSFAVFAQMLGFSLALGAFVMGAIVSESALVERVVRSVSPVRDLFTMLFFVSVGMLIDVRYLVEYFPVVAAVTLVVVVAKVVSRSVPCYLLGLRGETAMAVGMGLVPIGEFSFAIVKQGVDQGVVSDFLYPVLVAVATITTFLAPYTLGYAGDAARLIDRLAPSPVKNFFSYAAMWSTQVRRRLAVEGEEYRVIRRKASRVVLNLLVVFLVMRGMEYLGTVLHLSRSLVLGATFLLVLPPLYLAVKRVTDIVDIVIGMLGRRYLPLSVDLLRSTFRKLSLLVVFLFSVLYFLPPMLSYHTGSGAATTGIVALLLGAGVYLSWRTVQNFYRGVERMVESAFSSRGVLRGELEAKRRVLVGMREGEVVDEMAVEEGDFAVGRSIAELKVRERTGATILAIVRGGEVLHTPSPEERLLAGDVLIVFGSREQRRRLEELIRRGAG
ncbi:MAG: cation/H(+) antiporter [Euryarchaeota archaeon]|nr:cation/H(+) antiporter [Euryarchaeota archaeon]